MAVDQRPLTTDLHLFTMCRETINRGFGFNTLWHFIGTRRRILTLRNSILSDVYLWRSATSEKGERMESPRCRVQASETGGFLTVVFEPV